MGVSHEHLCRELAKDLTDKQRERILTAIEEQTRDAVDRAAEKGVRKTVRIMVVGVPNVGKSTFINRINGASIAQTGDRPGVTRNNQWIKITPWLEMLDTPGMLWPRLDDQLAARRLCYIGTVKDEILNLDDLVLNLLNDLKEHYGYTYIFITHDLSVVKFFSDRIMVMEKGRIVEEGPSDQLFANPQHPYTQRLLAAIPRL